MRFAVSLLILVMALFVATENAITAYAAPTISLSVSSGSPPIVGAGSVTIQPGTEVTISGTGFAALDNGCIITSSAPGLVIDTSGEPTCAVDGSGVLTAKFKVGAGSIWETGSYGITVTGTASGAVSTPGNAFAVLPAILLVPATGVGGTSISVYGSGFSGVTTVCSVLTGSPPVAASPVSTCAESMSPGATLGTVTGTFTVDPTSPAGSYFIQVGDASAAPIGTSPPFVVGGATAVLSFTPSQGPTGTVVTVTGTGWHTSDTSVTLTKLSGPSTTLWSGSNPQCSVSGGSIVAGCTFTVQSAALGGVYTITGTGTQGEDVNAQFEVTSTLLLSPLGGGAGTAVSLSGSGYAAAISSGVCPGDLSSVPSGLVTSASCSVNSAGILSGSFIVGTGLSAGVYQVILTAPSKVVPGPSVSASFSVGVAFVSLSSYSGPTGTIVTVTGSGWNSADTSVSFTYTGPGTLYVAPATRSCSISGGSIAAGCSFTVNPTALGGLYKLTFTGSQGDTAGSSFTVTSTLILTPSSGGGGTGVSLSGSGYHGAISAATCKSDLTSTPAGLLTAKSCSVNSSGVLSGSFTAATSATVGAYQVILTDSKVVPGPSVSATFTLTSAAPTITLNPTSVSPGGTVVISGSGFATADTCSSSSITSTPTNIIGSPANCHLSGGVLSITDFTVKAKATPGTYTITVTGSSGDAASATLTVTGPTITLNPTFISAGGKVSISGSGFATADTCSSSSITSTPTNIIGSPVNCHLSGGVLSTTFFTVRTTAASGTYSITLTGSSFDTASATLIVGSSSPVTLTPAAAPVGGTVGVQASDPSSGTAGTCSIDGSPVTFVGCSETAGGVITGSFIVSNVAPGPYQITITATSGAILFGVFTVEGPFIQLADPLSIGQVASGPTGSEVVITGAFFPLSDTTCSISTTSSSNFIASGTDACSVFAGTGIFAGFNNVTGSFIVGNVNPGQYVVQVTTDPSGTFAQAVFNVTSGPFIQLFPSIGPTGTSVTIEGTGFLPTDTTCSLSSPTSGDIVVSGACSFFTVTSGKFKGYMNVTGSFIVGNVPSGDYVIQVDGSGGDSAQAIFDVTIGASITLSPASGRIGIHVNVNGTNFLPTDTACTISSPTSGTIILDGACAVNAGTGKPEASFLVGNVPPGQYTIEVDGSPGGDSAQALFNVTTGPTLTLNPTRGRIGTDVVFSATGFLTTDTTCTITSPSTGVVLGGACSIALGSGAPTGSFTIGNVLPGQYLIEVDGNGGDFAQSVFNVTTGAKVTLSPATAAPGSHVNVNGTGFLPTDSVCTISSPGSDAVLSGSAGCAIQIGTGVTQGSFIVGNVVPGQYVIQVTGDQGDSAQTVLNVTSGPSITLHPGTATIGTSITVNGQGFLTTDQSCSISSPGTLNPILSGSAACAITVGTGVVTGSFIIGSVQPGEYVIEVTGCSGNNGCAPSAGDFAQAIVAVVSGAPTLTLSPTNATNGATVTFTAYGLSASDTACSVLAYNHATNTLDTNLITSPTCSIVTPTTAQGTFVVGPYATTNIPWNITVTGSPVNDRSPFAVFNVTASVVVTPTSGTINTVFTFTGSGFSSLAGSCAATVLPPFPTGAHPGCAMSANTGQVSGSIIVPSNALPGTYGINVGDLLGHNATGTFTVGTPSALVVLTPASVAQGQPVGVAGFGFNPSDAFCTISSSTGTALFATTPTCVISGGYASGSFTVSNTAAGGYYLISVQGCSVAPTANVCPPGDSLDFASNFLGVTLSSTVTTFSPTTTTSSTTTSVSTTTTSVATSFSFSSTTQSTTGILYTTYTHQSLTTVSGMTTTTISQTTSTTQTQTTVTVSTVTSFTTVPCGPLPCGFAIQPAGVNSAPGIDSAGLLAALLLVIPMLLRRLFT